MSGWIYRLQCTVCGMRVRRHERDYPGYLGDDPKVTVEIACSNCTCAAGYPDDEVKTLHFIDYATDEELENDGDQ